MRVTGRGSSSQTLSRGLSSSSSSSDEMQYKNNSPGPINDPDVKSKAAYGALIPQRVLLGHIHVCVSELHEIKLK